jgi:glycosyltransferase involved in cell wall biosynthesis
MRIAVFNWRDIRHPQAGGAEAFIHRLLVQLARDGHTVAMFASSYRDAPVRERIDGVEHFRYGGRFSMYLLSPSCYNDHVRGKFDVIVESVNGMPFFLPLFAEEPVAAFIHQLTRENWYSGLPFPLSFIGYHLEDTFLRPYRKRRAIVPSDSTRKDLRAIGFTDVHVMDEAVDISPPAGAAKEAETTFICLGRLARSKRVDHAIRALRRFRELSGSGKLWIAGSGPEEAGLRRLAASLGLSEHVRFFGRVGEREKAGLLSRAHFLLFPAVREGWGLVVLEANACRTPAIGYDVPGLRDSIKDGVNGALVPAGDHDAMAQAASRLISDKDGYARLCGSSAAYSEGFTWERSAREFLSCLGVRA